MQCRSGAGPPAFAARQTLDEVLERGHAGVVFTALDLERGAAVAITLWDLRTGKVRWKQSAATGAVR